MVNLGLCRRCPECEKYLPIERDGKGELISLPSVHCRIEGPLENASLGWDSKIPSGCIYLVEQKLTEEEAWNEYENMMEEIQGSEAVNEH